MLRMKPNHAEDVVKTVLELLRKEGPTGIMHMFDDLDHVTTTVIATKTMRCGCFLEGIYFALRLNELREIRELEELAKLAKDSPKPV